MPQILDTQIAVAPLPLVSRLGAGLRHGLLGISAREVEFGRRGFFDGLPAVRERLERVGRAFVEGYNAGLRHRSSFVRLENRLAAIPNELQGFAHEGAAMSLALVDAVTARTRSRWAELLERAPQHSYLIFVGAGWAVARLRRRNLPGFTRNADPVLVSLIWDGCGFHEGFFRPASTIRRQVAPPLRGYAPHVFDQGVGRSLWFVESGSPPRIAAAIAAFVPSRRPDLWSGVGLACAYAGGFDDEGVVALRRGAGPLSGEFAQGVAFAAAARTRAGNVAEWTERACLVACGGTAADAARVVDEELHRVLDTGPGDECYEAWQRALRRRFAVQGQSHV